MADIIQFPQKDEFEDNDSENLVVNMSELLSEWPMQSILLALFEAATEKADIEMIMPAVAPIIAREGLTIQDTEV